MIRLGLMSVCMVLLTGCGLKKFDCPYREGVSCRSLSEVNELVNRGEQGTRLVKKRPKKEHFFSQSLSLTQTPLSPSLKTPLRVPEQICRIWLAPFETVEGLFYPDHVVYIVATPSYWEGAK